MSDNLIYVSPKDLDNIEDKSKIYYIPRCVKDNELSDMFNCLLVDLSLNCKDGNINDVIVFFNLIINDYNNYRIQIDTELNLVLFNGEKGSEILINKKKIYLIYLYIVEAILYKKSYIVIDINNYKLDNECKSDLLNFINKNLNITFAIIEVNND